MGKKLNKALNRQSAKLYEVLEAFVPSERSLVINMLSYMQELHMETRDLPPGSEPTDVTPQEVSKWLTTADDIQDAAMQLIGWAMRTVASKVPH